MARRDAKGRERGRIWDWSWQVVQNGTRPLTIFTGCSRGGRDMRGWVGRGRGGHAECGQSTHVGSPGGDGQLHSLLFRSRD